MRAPLSPPEFVDWTMPDGYVTRGRLWPGRGDLGVLYLHGVQSHGGWYEWSASLLAQSGLTVVAPDRRGSGLNDADRGDVPHADCWLSDLDALTDQLAQTHGVRRWALCGVSWGGKLALAWALARPERVADLLLVAPGLFPAVDVSFRERLAIAGHVLCAPARRHAIPLSDPALFTDNPAGQAFISADNLKLTHATARFLYQSLRLDRRIRRARAGDLDAPVTLALAERDRIIRNILTRAFLEDLSGGRLTTALFDNASHTLEFEPDVSEYQILLNSWVTSIEAAHGKS